jgi:low affinity Fe/Cu permease
MRKKFEDFSKKLTRWIGSPQSIFVHTIFFIGMFSLRLFGISSSDVLLILTTVVSLEAIYLSIFIQMTVNQHSEELEEVSEDIEEIQEDVDEIQKDVDEIQEDVEDIQEEFKEDDKSPDPNNRGSAI